MGAAFLGFLASTAMAHPVPKDSHDRTIVVRLQNGETPNRLRVRVEYRLEVDEETVLLVDMHDYRDQVNFVDYFPQRPFEYYAHFTRIHAPIFADRLIASVHKNSWKPHCVFRKERLRDEDGKSLGHLRCDFVFEGEFEIDPSQPTRFFFHDQTFLSADIAPEKGYLVLSFVNETGLAIQSKTEPDATLYKKAMESLTSKEEDRQRKVTVVFAASAVPAPKTEIPAVHEHPGRESHEDRFSLLRLIMHSDYGFWLTMLLAFFFGSAHALTPGHGKTLVAAYLVGERGTVWHALFLGLVTTLTHTGVVILLAIIMVLLPDGAQRTFQRWIVGGLGLVLGLMVACMGFWLLLQRLAGKPDHVHIGGGHHHHHDHSPSARELNWWGLVMLGVTGGIVPCWDAIVLLFYTIGTNRIWLVLPAVLAFSAGLAVVLVLIGVLVVQVPRFVEARGGSGRLTRSLPMVSAIAVILVGLWLCFEWSQGR